MNAAMNSTARRSNVSVPTIDDLMGFNNELRHSLFWQNLLICLYTVLITTAVVGNCVIIVVIVTRRRLHKVTNVFVAALAVSDILKCSFNYPIELYSEIHGPLWKLGKELCYLVQPIFGMTVYSSALTMLAIAVDRYLLICWPHAKQISLRCSLGLVGGIVALSFGLVSPMVKFTEFYQHNINFHRYDLHVTLSFCTERWPDDAARLAYTIGTFLLQFVVPLAVTGGLYCAICVALRQRRCSRATGQRRAVALLVLIVVLHFLCWLPTILFTVLTDLSLNALSAPFIQQAIPYLATNIHIKVLCLKAFALSSTCINPVLYGWLNNQVKQELSTVVAIARAAYRRRSFLPSGAVSSVPEPPPDNGQEQLLPKHRNSQPTSQPNTSRRSTTNV